MLPIFKFICTDDVNILALEDCMQKVRDIFDVVRHISYGVRTC